MGRMILPESFWHARIPLESDHWIPMIGERPSDWAYQALDHAASQKGSPWSSGRPNRPDHSTELRPPSSFLKSKNCSHSFANSNSFIRVVFSELFLCCSKFWIKSFDAKLLKRSANRWFEISNFFEFENSKLCWASKSDVIFAFSTEV